jgi:hypothetical protein
LAGKQKLVTLARDLFSDTFEAGDKIVVQGAAELAGFEIYGLGRETTGSILAIGYE